MKVLKNVIAFILIIVLLPACTPSVNTEITTNKNQTTTQSSSESSTASAELPPPAEPIDSKIIDEINSGSLELIDLKIGDLMDKAFAEIEPPEYEMMYQNDYCIPMNGNYILYNYNIANQKQITGIIYNGREKFKGIDLEEATIDDVQEIYKKPTNISEDKWTELYDYDNDASEYRKELYYEVGEYVLYFDFYDNTIQRIVYKKNNASDNLPTITERFQIDSLKKLLNEQREIRTYKSPSSNDIVFTARNSDASNDVYLWREEDEKPEQIQPVSDSDDDVSFEGTWVTWSPDGEYFILDCGSSPSRSDYLVSTADCKINMTFSSYICGPLWTLDGKEIILVQPSKVMLKADVGDGESNDITIYNLETKKVTAIEKGTADYYFTYDSIIGNELTYIREYPESGKKESIKINLK